MIVKWNVEGLNERGKRRVVKEVIKWVNLVILLLPDTKIMHANWGFMNSIGCCRCKNWVLMESKGRSRGIL